MTKPLRPKLAASLIIVDKSGPAIRLLMGRRSDAHVFMPGYHVFPGGAYERQDRNGPAVLTDDDAQRIATTLPARQNTPAMAQAIARTALRELEEETAWRLKNTGQPGLLRPLGRAITPPGMVRRYDTRFFIADSSRFERSDNGPDNELLDIGWLTMPAPETVRIHTITEAMIAQVMTVLSGSWDGRLPCFRIRNGMRIVDYE